MRTIVPVGVRDPKTRLDGVLDPDERAAFAAAMLGDVLAAVEDAGGDPVVLADASLDEACADRPEGVPATAADLDAPVLVDDRALTPAVEDAIGDALAAEAAAAVVMADLPIVTPATVQRLYAAADESPVAIAPGLGGGTNALVVSDPAYELDYHGASVRDHRAAARDIGVEPAEVDSFRLAADVDEPGDLAEVLLHGEGEAAAWLREAGFAISAENGRVGVVRE